jgi:tRNA (cmo5U34)-methyltransferase
MSHPPKDRLFAAPRDQHERFRFDDHVAQVFADMVSRSVPGYDLTLTMIGVLAAHYAQENSVCYDLGCSLGASTLAMRHRVPPNCRIIAIDNSTAMTERCRANIAGDRARPEVAVVCADIQDIDYANASLATLNFTLQFVPAEQRLDLLRRLQHGLIAGGALILSEKIALPGDRERALFEQLHHDFKHAMGYSRLEIAQKRAALEQVLIPDSLDTHKERLHRAGFSEVYTWFQCFNFISLLAVK